MSRSKPSSSIVAEHLVFVNDLPVYLRYKAVKNLTLHIDDPSGTVWVSVPLGMPPDEALAFVRSKFSWIAKKLTELVNSPRYHAQGASDEEKSAWKEAVSACVPALVEAWEPIMGVKVGKLAYRAMKSRWGSCQPATGRICINTRLALYPPACLEYVVVHEMCHLLEGGHGPRFQTLMDAFMPDWRERRAKLRS